MFVVPDAIDRLPNKNEVFRRAGEALYRCQCFEGALIFALHIYKQIRCEADPSWQIHQEMIHELRRIGSEGWGFRKATLGRLLKELREVVFIHPEADEALDKALDVRNHLIHRHFLSPEWETVLCAGASYEIGSLDKMVEQLKTAHEVAATIVQSLQRKLDEARTKSSGQGP